VLLRRRTCRARCAEVLLPHSRQKAPVTKDCCRASMARSKCHLRADRASPPGGLTLFAARPLDRLDIVYRRSRAREISHGHAMSGPSPNINGPRIPVPRACKEKPRYAGPPAAGFDIRCPREGRPEQRSEGEELLTISRRCVSADQEAAINHEVKEHGASKETH
jgi:hypothetical protein